LICDFSQIVFILQQCLDPNPNPNFFVGFGSTTLAPAMALSGTFFYKASQLSRTGNGKSLQA
jgi:hypothetical protein